MLVGGCCFMLVASWCWLSTIILQFFFSWGHLSLAIGFKAGLRDSVQAAAPDSITGAALMKGWEFTGNYPPENQQKWWLNGHTIGIYIYKAISLHSGVIALQSGVKISNCLSISFNSFPPFSFTTARHRPLFVIQSEKIAGLGLHMVQPACFGRGTLEPWMVWQRMFEAQRKSLHTQKIAKAKRIIAHPSFGLGDLRPKSKPYPFCVFFAI